MALMRASSAAWQTVPASAWNRSWDADWREWIWIRVTYPCSFFVERADRDCETNHPEVM